MNATATLLGILAVIVAAIPIYFLARSNGREIRRQRNEDVAKAVRDGIEPVQAALDRCRLDLRDANTIVRERDRRIEQLEDELRRTR